MRRAVVAAGLVMAAVMPTMAAEVTIGAFAPGSLGDWETKSFAGETRYRLVGNGNNQALEATCEGTASAIALRRPVALDRTPVLRWEWRVAHVYDGLDGTTKAGDDYPARIYVIHDGGVLAWRTRAMNYVWANTQPSGNH